MSWREIDVALPRARAATTSGGGLLLDLDATADRTCTDRASHAFLHALDQLSSGDHPRPSSNTTGTATGRRPVG